MKDQPLHVWVITALGVIFFIFYWVGEIMLQTHRIGADPMGQQALIWSNAFLIAAMALLNPSNKPPSPPAQ